MQAQRAAMPLRVPGSSIVAPNRPLVKNQTRVQQRQRPLAPFSRMSARRIVCSSSGVAHPGEEASWQGGSEFGGSPFNAAFMIVPNIVAAKGAGRNYGSGGAMGGAVLERSRIEIVMPTPPVTGPKLDDGGSGGDIGKNIFNGGGGGDDGGDDDDFFQEGDDDGEGDGSGGGRGDGFFRTAIPELYDRLSIGAVLSEWYRTVADLPLFIRRAVEMGLYSSAQLTRFLSTDVRPGMVRSVSRALPTSWAREFVGRLMADPAFVHKLALEQLLAFGSSMYYESRVRGERFKQELDLALINSLGMAAAVGATVWVTAPSRSYGAVNKMPWQEMLAGLPHCVFDASGPLRRYTATQRVGGFFASMAQLSAVGALAGGATSLATNTAVALHKRADPSYSASVAPPDAARSSAGLGAFFAVNANTRYQLIGGMDRYLFGHSNFIWTYGLFSAVARGLGACVGELSRPWWQGLPTPSSGAQHAPRVVRRRVKRRVARTGASAAAAPAPAAAAAAAVMAGPPAEAGGAPAADPAGVSQTGVALQDFQPVAAGDDPSSSGSGEGLQNYAPVAAERQPEAEAQLLSGPAVMGSPEQLQQLVALRAQQQQQQQQASDNVEARGVRQEVFA